MGQLYDEYLHDHIENVRKGFDWLVNHGIIDPDDISDVVYLLDHHDASKYTDEEYGAYDKYFYGTKSFETVKNFNYAWLHHIHNNPHHWQYWVLQHDDEGEEVLEMPKKYAIEMICDWWSFSWKTGKLDGIFDWYEKHKDMKLNPSTREFVEAILDRIQGEINEHGILEHHGIKGQKWGVKNGPPYPIQGFRSAEELSAHMKQFSYKEFDKLMSADEVENQKRGSCHDQVMYEFQQLRRLGKNPKGLFFIEVNDSGQGGTTHSLVYWVENGKTYWFENAWSGMEGIRQYDDVETLKKEIERLYYNGKTGNYKKYGELAFGDFEESEHDIGEDLQELVDKCLK